MAKQRRPIPRSKKPPPEVSLRAAGPSSSAGAPASAAASASGPPRRSTYFEAVALYEQGLEKLQRHEYRAAAETFEAVLRQYADEKELHERVRLYLNICQRHAAPRESAPQTLQERLFASTIAINSGRYDEAISHLRLVRDEDPDNDHALYMLAVAHAQRGELAEAVAHLERAIAMNSENRALARTDPDLEPLREDDAFHSAVDGSSTARGERRRPLRPRPTR